MNTLNKKHYYEDFYFSFIQYQYEYYKRVFHTPEQCIYKDIGLPSEIILGTGLYPAIVEITVGLLPPSNLTEEVVSKADRYFYDSGVCSFNKLALPAFESGALPLPKAFACFALCQESTRNFEVLAQKFKREYLSIDVPYTRSPEAVSYVARQFEELARSLCRIAGHPFDIDQLRECIRKSNAASGFFYAANELRKRRPALFFGGQMLKFMNVRWFWGTAEAVKIAKQYYEISKERSATAITPVDEKFRILWCNLGLVYDSTFFEYMEKELHTSIAFEEMNYTPAEPMDEREPFIALARRILDTDFIGDVRRRAELLTRLVAEYQIDGIIFFSHVNCRLFNPKLRLLKEALNRCQIPVLEISADALDQRSYNRAQLTTRLEAFVEMLDSKKALTQES